MLILSFLFLMFGCEGVAVLPDTGTVEGKVSIGPLCGIVPAVVNNSNPCGFSDDQLNQIYSKYKVAISGMVDGKSITKEFVLNKTGIFSFEVPTGSYKVEVILPDGSVNQNGLMSANDLKKDVTVSKNQVTKVDLEVSTGIR
jgi:hypothetical protein